MSVQVCISGVIIEAVININIVNTTVFVTIVANEFKETISIDTFPIAIASHFIALVDVNKISSADINFIASGENAFICVDKITAVV